MYDSQQCKSYSWIYEWLLKIFVNRKRIQEAIDTLIGLLNYIDPFHSYKTLINK